MFDIVFISYNEENADYNWNLLKSRFPNSKRVHGIKGIHAAHIQAAKISFTKMFWVVDGDAEICENFMFNETIEKEDYLTVHVCRSINPVNNLIYGYGGVKLFPRKLVLQMDTNTADMTTSISENFKVIDQISNITRFNTSPFNTWKSAFRECCKLSSQSIRNQNQIETDQRLKIWTTVGKEQEYGEYAIAGANAGKEYGIDNANNAEAIKKINDFEWLKDWFNKNYG